MFLKSLFVLSFFLSVFVTDPSYAARPPFNNSDDMIEYLADGNIGAMSALRLLHRQVDLATFLTVGIALFDMNVRGEKLYKRVKSHKGNLTEFSVELRKEYEVIRAGIKKMTEAAASTPCSALPTIATPTKRHKLNFSTNKTIIIGLAEGNPKAKDILERIVKGQDETHGHWDLLVLDDMNMRGEQIVVAFEKIAGKDLVRFMSLYTKREMSFVNQLNELMGPDFPQKAVDFDGAPRD